VRDTPELYRFLSCPSISILGTCGKCSDADFKPNLFTGFLTLSLTLSESLSLSLSLSRCMYIYIYLYIYIYIYPPAPLGAIRLRRILLQLLFPSPSGLSITSPQSSFPVQVCKCQFTSLVSAFKGLQISNLVFGNCLLDPRDEPTTINLEGYLNLGPPREPLKNHQISSLSPGPSKIKKTSPQGHQKVSK
jgi:hypothetical protein